MDNEGIDTRRLRLELFTEEALLRLQHRRANALKEYGVIPQRRARLPEWEILVYPPYPASLYGKPVVEVDHFTLDKAFCVVTRRFSKYYLYRFSATKSLFLFSPWSSIREKAIQISTHRYFDYLVMITILVNCVFLALSSPPEETEYVFLTIYSVEMIIKCIAKGFILNQYTYLRNFWNWLDFIVVLSGYLTLLVPSDGLDVGSLAGLRTFRVLRALKTVSILPGLKTIVNAMLHSIKMLAEVMALTIFCLMVFALLALQLYMGNLRHSCVNTNHTDSENLTLLLEDGVPQLCGNASGARSCPDGFSCYPDVAPNPNFGYTNFDSYGWAILNCLQLITLDYWEDIYNKILEVSGPASIFYFILVIFLGSFYIVNLTLAVVAICYEEEAANAIRERDKAESMKKAPRMSKIFTKLRDQQSPSVEMARKKIHRRTSRPRPYNDSLTDSEEPPDDSESEIAPHPYRPPLVHHPPPMGAPDLVISAQLHHAHLQPDDPTSSQEDSDAESQPVMQIRRSRSRMGHSSADHARARSLLGAELGESSANEITEDMPQIRGCWENRRDSKDEEDPSNRKTAKLSTRFRACQHAGRNICSWTRKLLIVIVTDPLFDLLITTCILVNTAFLAAEHHGMTKEMQSVLVHGNLVFTIIFSLEAIMKLLALRREYFESKWNIFDLAVVAVSLMDLGLEQVSGLSVLRTFRLLRVLKLAQAWPTMRMLLGIIATTLGAVGNMTLVLSVIVYIFAVLGMQLFAATYTEENFAPDPVPRWNFSDFWHSLLVVFRVLCGEWVQPLWECLQAAPDKKHLCFVVFLSALTVGNFLVLNLFLAMLLNSFNSRELTEREENSKDSKVMAGFRKLRHVLSRRQNSVDNQEPEEEVVIPEVRGPPPKQPKIAWEIVKAGHSVIELATLGYEPANISDDDGHPEGTPERNRDSMERRRTEPDDCFPALCYTKFPFLIDPPDWLKQIRLVAFRITEHRVFEWVVLILIFASSILLCFEDVYLPEKPQWQLVLNTLNLIFTACFVLEMLLKWFGHGLFAYFSSFWTVMDFVIVNISVLSIALESAGSGLYALRAIRTLRALRPLRAVSRWQGMRIVVNALVSAIPAIFNVLLVCILFWLIFSIMGVQFFGGRFYKCVDDEGERLPLEVVYNRSQCSLLNLTWQNSMINFDNVGNAYLALFQVATFEGWLEIMSDATDSREVDEQPAREANMLAAVYFVVFIICGSFFTLNLFIGVIIDNFNMLKKKYEGGILEMFLTESQKTYYTAMQKLGRKKPQRIISRPKNPLQALFYDVAISRKFEILVFILILLNMLAMSCEHYQQPELLNSVLAGLNIAFTACFCLEAAIKIIGLRQHYFKVPWNVFDLTVVGTSIIGIIFEEVLQTFVISPTLLRVIRLVRIGRVLRLVKAAKGIRKLLFALIISLPALFNIGALLFLVMFIYAIIGMSFFGHVKHTGALTETVNFETFAHSMLLLFRLCTSAGWNDVLEPLLVQPPDCDIHYKGLPNGDCGQPVNAVFYLVTYIIINYMVIINMYIAIILENLNQASQEEEMGITEDDIENFYNYWARYDPHATQFIHFSQLSDFISGLDPPLVIPKPNVLALVAMNLPICQGNNVHCLDVLHGLTRMFLGDVEDTEEFRKLRDQMDQRFLKSFPSRNQVEVISSSYDWKRREVSAIIIQRAFRRFRLAKKRDASKTPS